MTIRSTLLNKGERALRPPVAIQLAQVNSKLGSDIGDSTGGRLFRLSNEGQSGLRTIKPVGQLQPAGKCECPELRYSESVALHCAALFVFEG
jgi:hypothetical protein